MKIIIQNKDDLKKIIKVWTLSEKSGKYEFDTENFLEPSVSRMDVINQIIDTILFDCRRYDWNSYKAGELEARYTLCEARLEIYLRKTDDTTFYEIDFPKEYKEHLKKVV